MSRANFVQVQLAQAATDIQTTLSVKAPVGGFKLPPADGGRLVLTDSLGQPSAFEVITYTGRTGSGPYTLTGVVRGVEGTVGLAWGVDTFVLQALTVGDLQELMDSKLGVGATAVAAVKLATARTIGGVSFDGTANINLPGVNAAGNQNTSGNAATATKLQTARTIGGVSFDGSANINLPGVNAAGNQNTSGNAATASKLATARTIGGVSFDGSANIDLPGVNAAGNQDTSGNAATATKLAAARTINGVAFDGSADITVVDSTKEPAIPAGTTAQYVAGNKTLRTFAADVRAAALTGLNTATNSAIAAADTLLVAMGKLQAQITGLGTSKLDATANAVSASKLQTARTIGGVAFDGTADINLPGVNAAGNQNTTGNAATATKLQTARTINGVAFDGTANITVADSTKLPLAGGDMTGDLVYQNVGSGGWARGLTAKIQSTGAYVAGIGFLGNSDSVSTAYLGIGSSPWASGNGVRVTAAGVTISGATTFDTLITGSVNGNAGTATKLATARTIGGVAFDGTANINLPGVNAAGNQDTSGNAATATKLATARTINGTSFSGEANIVTTTWGTARTITIGATGKSVNGSGNISWTLAEIGAVTSDVDTTPGRLLTTDYLDIGKLDKTLWPKATSLLTLKNGPDRTVWVETDTVDAPHPGFYGTVTSRRLSSTTAIIEAQPLFEMARYFYTFTPLGNAEWVKETAHEVGEWVDLRPYLISPFFWKSARDGNNHFPQIRLVDRNTVELRGVVSFNATSAAPPTGAVAFRVPEGFRPQLTSGGLCMADATSPFWFGSTGYLVQGQVNYNGNPNWANGNVQLLLIGAPDPVADGAVDLSGIRYYLS